MMFKDRYTVKTRLSAPLEQEPPLLKISGYIGQK